MANLDWIVLLGSLFLIVAVGTWKTRKSSTISGYLKGDNTAKWWTVGFSVMATQASAITFISTPGQAYAEGMGFVQFYFGLPIAMIIIAAVFVPIYHKLRVYTAYEYLEQRFDLRTRQFTALLFLVSRGLAAGITIYAPAIVLSNILGWDLKLTCIFIGVLVIIYTVSGGTRAVNYTQKWQLAIMMGGILFALGWLIHLITGTMPLGNAVHLASDLGRLDVVDTGFDPSQKYNLWSGLIGGTFLALGYFGTDQSQVGRYLGGKSIREIRIGLIFNALLKIPMQFIILFVGVLTFVFFIINPTPIHFNEVQLDKVRNSEYTAEIADLENRLEVVQAEKFSTVGTGPSVNIGKVAEEEQLREEARALIKTNDPSAETDDTDYVFLHFITNYMPIGIIGLLLAMIFSAAMSSTAAELNALGGTATVDFYKRSVRKSASDKHYVLASKGSTLVFGILAIAFALGASLFDNLIEAVNRLGSLFYGTILGVFLVAFFLKWIKGRAVLIAAITAEAVVLSMFLFSSYGNLEIGYLWYNLIGPAVVIAVAFPLQLMFGRGSTDTLVS